MSASHGEPLPTETDVSQQPGEDETRESNQTLWMLIAAPTIWAAHFLASYLTVAIWCAKVVDRGEPLGAARTAVGVYTGIALVLIAIIGWIGFRRQSFGAATMPHDFDSPADRHRFLGFSTVLLASLSALATIFVALAAVFVENCH